ncbi:hypothetical protein Tco_1189801 [Tanacetum coccineum]
MRSNATLRSSTVAGEVSAVFSTPCGSPSTRGKVKGRTCVVVVGLSMVLTRSTQAEEAKKEILIPGYEDNLILMELESDSNSITCLVGRMFEFKI